MRSYDIVVFGATGFTGRLVAQYLAQTIEASNKKVLWALAGRNIEKINETKSIIFQETGIDISSLPSIIADSSNVQALEEMVKLTKVIISTVGPYIKYGEKLVAACASNGTHYCDLTGEVIWVKRMIDKYDAIAKQNQAKIVHCCGFDSIPSDLGCFMMIDHMKRVYGTQPDQVKCLVDKIKGTASGGTIASMFEIQDYAWKNGFTELRDGYLLNPADRKPNQNIQDQKFGSYDSDFKVWTTPFVMASCNTRIVRRSIALLTNQSDKQISYTETRAVKGKFAFFSAMFQALGLFIFLLFAYYPFTRIILKKVVPAPGEGPSKEFRDAGYFRFLLCAKTLPDASKKSTIVKGSVSCRSADPGYKGTAIMLSETAFCLAFDTEKIPERFGVLTPATACGSVLISRLNNAGLTFQIEEDDNSKKRN